MSALNCVFISVQGKLDDLRNEAEKLALEHPDQAGEIQGHLEEIQEVWEELNATMKRREESLGEASKLQGFLRDLNDFQSWLSRTQTAVASEDIPTSVPEAESLLAQHESIKNEVDNYKEDYEKMRAVGEEVTQGQTDAQHMFLAQRLQALDTGWHELRRMWENRHNLLAQAFDFQTFLRDAKQAEAFLNNQVRKTLNGAEACTTELKKTHNWVPVWVFSNHLEEVRCIVSGPYILYGKGCYTTVGKQRRESYYHSFLSCLRPT